jgi:dihydroxyacetone kinase
VCDLHECVIAAASALERSRDELGRLDAAAGDGDHGMTMTMAARAARKVLEEAPDANAADLFVKLALAAGSVGGASGPLYAAGLMAVAGTVRQAAGEEVSVGLIARCAESADAAISRLGGARPGDKTILDALHPAATALGETAAVDIGTALSDAAAAARKGAEATAGMTANIGRARALGERSRGFADPGATSCAVILEAAASACRGLPPR